MAIATHKKDPDAVLDYGFDWRALTNGTGDTDWLELGEILFDADWTVASGITKDSESLGSDVTLIWLSGGIAGTSYIVSCKITTTEGRTDKRSMTIIVTER